MPDEVGVDPYNLTKEQEAARDQAVRDVEEKLGTVNSEYNSHIRNRLFVALDSKGNKRDRDLVNDPLQEKDLKNIAEINDKAQSGENGDYYVREVKNFFGFIQGKVSAEELADISVDVKEHVKSHLLKPGQSSESFADFAGLMKGVQEKYGDIDAVGQHYREDFLPRVSQMGIGEVTEGFADVLSGVDAGVDADLEVLDPESPEDELEESQEGQELEAPQDAPAKKAEVNQRKEDPNAIKKNIGVAAASIGACFIPGAGIAIAMVIAGAYAYHRIQGDAKRNPTQKNDQLAKLSKEESDAIRSDMYAEIEKTGYDNDVDLVDPDAPEVDESYGKGFDDAAGKAFRDAENDLAEADAGLGRAREGIVAAGRVGLDQDRAPVVEAESPEAVTPPTTPAPEVGTETPAVTVASAEPVYEAPETTVGAPSAPETQVTAPVTPASTSAEEEPAAPVGTSAPTTTASPATEAATQRSGTDASGGTWVTRTGGSNGAAIEGR